MNEEQKRIFTVIIGLGIGLVIHALVEEFFSPTILHYYSSAVKIIIPLILLGMFIYTTLKSQDSSD